MKRRRLNDGKQNHDAMDDVGRRLRDERSRRNENSLVPLPRRPCVGCCNPMATHLQELSLNHCGLCEASPSNSAAPTASTESLSPAPSFPWHHGGGSSALWRSDYAVSASDATTTRINVIDGNTGHQFGVVLTRDCTVRHFRAIVANVVGIAVEDQALGVGGRDLTQRHLQDLCVADACGAIFETVGKCSVVVFHRLRR